jgi:hypothetical protein
MSKIEIENITISKWVISIGQNGISLLEKRRVDKFDVVSASRWGISHPSALIENLIAQIPEMETLDLVLDDHVTTISYITPAVPYSGTAVTEESGTVIVQFYDILKSRACKLVSEKSDLDEMVAAFSPFFSRTRRIVLRGPTQDFRYIVYIETSIIVQKPKAWTASIGSALSSVFIPHSISRLKLARLSPARLRRQQNLWKPRRKISQSQPNSKMLRLRCTSNQALY